MTDQWNAFVKNDLNIKSVGSGNLDGLTCGIKDVMSIKGYQNAAGNPDWLRTHEPANENAPVINRLLEQGATITGTTHTDELMFSLNGENFHYGTPINPNSPGRIPGGSSSGSAVAVAAGLVDFAIGTDTGGSVRIPSSYCGIFGFRPTHGYVDIAGVIPLAKSFDTVGWMAREADLLLKVGETLIPPSSSGEQEFTHFYLEEEAWSFLEEESKQILLKAVSNSEEKSTLKIAEAGLSEWANLFRTIQGIEIWKEHGEWIERERPTFGPGIAERFLWTSTLNQDELEPKIERKEKIKEQLSKLLKDNGLLVIPTAPGEAPLKNLSMEKMEQYRSRTMQLTCIAGLTGFPQVTIPFVKEDGLPIGLSFIANEFQDLNLLKWTNLFVTSLREAHLI
ncbi:amidase [Robertmurraya yapensis]|uniref:Amidase n=1 Tax=Bacillus yapensis TaxID=2492960 RepID=A0A3S0KIS7_9BACI|nr:amidase [Bacillus yapensis]RTR31843.1 amidase [Bacillus yapensis]TKS95856.1 amidase [Bacillus yapensis]